MPPKKASTASAKKSATGAAHKPYLELIKEAVVALKERNGSSRQALKKYVQANNNLSGVSESAFTTQFNRALQKGSESGVFARPKGTSGPVKLAAPNTAASKPATKTKAKPPTATKTAAAKKVPAKKTTAKSATKKAPAKKATATKSKTAANTGKARKTAPAAPAVEEKEPVVLGKTKSGRVTKSKAPQAVAKTIAPGKKRGAPAKKATPKKSTPKKA